MSIIKLEHLSKHYFNRRGMKRDLNSPDKIGATLSVFKDINLEFEEGELVCILGPSGCGKSTMLKIMAGFESPSSGRVIVDGSEVTGPNRDNVFVFQQNGLLPWMTVWENVELGLRQMTDHEEKISTIQDYIVLVELAGFEHHYPHELSGGMQRRAELARALAINPRVLFLDEPFTGLDYLTHLKVREEIINLHTYIGKSMTMVMVTHFIEDALLMADRIIVMSEPPTEVLLERTLSFSRARNIEKEPMLRELRDEIFMMLGVSYVA